MNGERDAVRDVATLFYLFVGVNARFMEERRALCLLGAFLSSSLGHWFREGKLPVWDEPLDRRLTSAIEELYGWQVAVDLLSERYYQGVSPLLPETEENLTWIVEQIERLVDLFNDHRELEVELTKLHGKRKPKLPAPINIAAAKRSAEPRAKAHVSLLVDLAQAQACEMMGERKRALAFVERHV